ERKRYIRRAGIATGALGTALILFAVNYLPPAIWVAVLFAVAGFSCLLWNYLKLISLAGFVLSVITSALLATFHAYLSADNLSTHLALFAVQGSFWFMPFLIFHPKEKTKITISVACSIALALFMPFLKNIIATETDVTLSTGISLVFSLTSGVFLFSMVYSLIAVNKKADVKEESLIKLTLKQQQDLGASEKKLNDYVKESEKTQEEEGKRRWITEGIAAVGEILR